MIFDAIVHMFAQDPLSSAVGAIVTVTALIFARLMVDR